jgi:hypothetical protein
MSDPESSEPKGTLVTLYRFLIVMAIFLAVTIAINWR